MPECSVVVVVSVCCTINIVKNVLELHCAKQAGFVHGACHPGPSALAITARNHVCRSGAHVRHLPGRGSVLLQGISLLHVGVCVFNIIFTMNLVSQGMVLCHVYLCVFW